MKNEQQIQQVNGAIEMASRELKRCKEKCARHGSPLRSITFKVLRNGETRMHVMYRKLKKNSTTHIFES